MEEQHTIEAVLKASGLGNFQRKMQRASESAEKFREKGQRLRKNGMKMTKSITTAVAGVASIIGKAVNDAANEVDRLNTLADTTGTTIENLQGLEYWAEKNGIGQQQFEKALKRTNQRMGLASEGATKYVEAFEDLGVKIENQEGKMRDTNDVFASTISALSQLEDSSIQAAKAKEVLGTKTAQDVLPAIKKESLTIAEAQKKVRDMPGFINEKDAKKMQEFADQMVDLKWSMKGLWTEIGVKLIPLVKDSLIPLIKNDIVPILDVVIGAVGKVADWFGALPKPIRIAAIALIGLAATIGPIIIAIGAFVQSLAAIVPAIAAISAPVWIVIGVIIALIGIIALTIKYWDKIKAAVKTAWNFIVDYIKKSVENLKSFLTGMMDAIGGAFAKIGKLFKKIPELFGKMKNAMIKTAKKFILKLSGKFGRLIISIKDKVEKIPDVIGNAMHDFYEAGKNMIMYIVKGIKSAFGSAIDTVKDLFSKIRDLLPFSPPKDKTSPLAGIDDNGIMDQIMKGIAKKKSKAVNKMKAAMAQLRGVAESQEIESPKIKQAAMAQHDAIKHRLEDTISISGKEAAKLTQANAIERRQQQGQPIPANIRMSLGGKEFDGFVDDISHVQDRKVQLRNAY